jgi:hypothetical protein
MGRLPRERCRSQRLGSPDATAHDRRPARSAMARGGTHHASRTASGAPWTCDRAASGDAVRTLPLGSDHRHGVTHHRGVPGCVVPRDPRGANAGGQARVLSTRTTRARVSHRRGRSGRGRAQPAGTSRRTSHPRCSRHGPSGATPLREPGPGPAILWRLPLFGREQLGKPPSSSGLGHRPFKAAARVRIPLGARSTNFIHAGVEESGVLIALSRRRSRDRSPSPAPDPPGQVAQLAEHAAENRGVGSSILPLATDRPKRR